MRRWLWHRFHGWLGTSQSTFLSQFLTFKPSSKGNSPLLFLIIVQYCSGILNSLIPSFFNLTLSTKCKSVGIWNSLLEPGVPHNAYDLFISPSTIITTMSKCLVSSNCAGKQSTKILEIFSLQLTISEETNQVIVPYFPVSACHKRTCTVFIKTLFLLTHQKSRWRSGRGISNSS